jgi:hypothetical protein
MIHRRFDARLVSLLELARTPEPSPASATRVISRNSGWADAAICSAIRITVTAGVCARHLPTGERAILDRLDEPNPR